MSKVSRWRMKIEVMQDILGTNMGVADENRAVFEATGILALNMMASPGAGKTSLILATVERLPPGIQPGVIEGDLASSIDAERIAAHSIPVTQINTGGTCHLEAAMIRDGLHDL